MTVGHDVSLVILNYNGREHLEECFESIEGMSFPRERLEVILADNGSTDGSLDLVRDRFPWVSIHEHRENLGFSGGNNRAADRAKGRFVAFLNNDIRVDAGWLEPLLEVLDRNPDAICAGSRVLDFEGKRILYDGGELNFCGFGYQKGMGDPVERHPPGEIEETPFATGCAMLARRAEFVATGGFDEDYFAYYEDVDLGWRWWVLGHRVLYVPASVIYHKGDASFQHSPSDSKQLMWNRNVLCSMVKNYEEAHLKKLLPVAILLTLERALYFLDVEGAEETGRVLAHFPGVEEEVAHERREAVGIAHLRAIQEAILELPTFLAKRREIQSRRKRTDEEIFRRFSLRVDFEDQVNELSRRSLACRLLPMLSVDDLLRGDRIDEQVFRNLKQLERAVSHYQSTLEQLHEEIRRRDDAVEHWVDETKKLNEEVKRLVPIEMELERIKRKKWYRAIVAARRLLPGKS